MNDVDDDDDGLNSYQRVLKKREGTASSPRQMGKKGGQRASRKPNVPALTPNEPAAVHNTRLHEKDAIKRRNATAQENCTKGITLAVHYAAHIGALPTKYSLSGEPTRCAASCCTYSTNRRSHLTRHITCMAAAAA
eukprot:SAG11_NODE_5069_length_1673_cov_1.497143_2_plen_136_part_00